MSLNIPIDHITAVLLADGWHNVAGESFDIDAYEFITGTPELPGALIYNGERQGCSTGFTFREPGDHLGPGRGEPPTVISGPITSILAVRR